MGFKVDLGIGTTIEKIYDDLFHPSFKRIGELVALAPRAVKIMLLEQFKYVIYQEHELEAFKQGLEQKLSEIPEEQLCPPDKNLFFCTMQYLSTKLDGEEVRDFFANLLVSGMNKDLRGYVHPSFPFIVSQLCPDEARLLSYLTKDRNRDHVLSNHVFPIVVFNAQEQRQKSAGEDVDLAPRKHITVLKNWTYVEDSCELNQEMIPAYLENLQKQGVIEIDYVHALSDEQAYQKLNSCPLLDRFKQLHPQYEITFAPGIFKFTSLGLKFLQVCMSDSEIKRS